MEIRDGQVMSGAADRRGEEEGQGNRRDMMERMARKREDKRRKDREVAKERKERRRGVEDVSSRRWVLWRCRGVKTCGVGVLQGKERKTDECSGKSAKEDKSRMLTGAGIPRLQTMGQLLFTYRASAY
jgi:hypothetical protein